MVTRFVVIARRRQQIPKRNICGIVRNADDRKARSFIDGTFPRVVHVFTIHNPREGEELIQRKRQTRIPAVQATHIAAVYVFIARRAFKFFAIGKISTCFHLLQGSFHLRAQFVLCRERFFVGIGRLVVCRLQHTTISKARKQVRAVLFQQTLCRGRTVYGIQFLFERICKIITQIFVVILYVILRSGNRSVINFITFLIHLAKAVRSLEGHGNIQRYACHRTKIHASARPAGRHRAALLCKLNRTKRHFTARNRTGKVGFLLDDVLIQPFFQRLQNRERRFQAIVLQSDP